MKLVVLKLIFIFGGFSDFANFINLRKNQFSDEDNDSHIDSPNETGFYKDSKKNEMEGEAKEEKINFESVLMNLKIIERKINQFKSKLSGK